VTTADLIAVGALVTALFSLLISTRGHYTAKRAVAISEAEHQERHKEIVGYLINGFKWSTEDENYASFAISYTNSASYPNSFKDIVLEIEYYDAERLFNRAKLPPSIGVMPVALRESREELNAPINIPPKETKSGWITFKLPKAEGIKFNIDTYRVVATSLTDENTVVESYILKSIWKNEE
jgi:hypothetical protein